MSSKQWMAAAGVGLAPAGAAAWGWWHGTAVAGVRESYARIVAPAAGVLIARALAMRPPLLLADEPTGNLDTKSAEAVFALLRRFSAEAGMAVLFVTHNPELARRCDRLIEVVDGLIASR